MQYTAEVTAEDEADKAVTWSVVDPTTGQATDKATINETSGLLTAEKSGAVEVVAKTKWFRSKKITFYPSGRSGACGGNYN